MSHRLTLVAAGLALLAGACKDDATTPAEVNTRTSAIVESAVVNAGAGLTTLADDTTLSALGDALASLDAAFANVPSAVPAGLGGDAPATPGALALRAIDPCAADPSGPGCAEPEPTPEETAARVSEFFAAHVFTEANLEEADDTSATFLIRDPYFCTVERCDYSSCDLQLDPNCSGACTEVVDAMCVALLPRLAIRLKATLVGDDGVDIDLLVGPGRANPLSLELRPERIAAEVDLGAGKAAVVHLASVTGVLAELPAVVAGRVRWEILVGGVQDVTISVSVVTAIDVQIDLPAGRAGVAIAAAEPLYSVHVEGLARRLSMVLDAGAVDVFLPYALATNKPGSTGTLSFHLDGASFNVTLSPDAAALVVDDIGLGVGPSWIKKNDVVLAQLDLNADSGRRLSLVVTPDAGRGTATFAVSPEVDVAVYYGLASIAADFGTIDPYFFDQTLRLELTGTSGASVTPIAADVPAGFSGGLEVTSGTLRLSASASGAVVDVPTGSCLVADPFVSGDDAVLGYFAAAACP